jgi:hypothetical protein
MEIFHLAFFAIKIEFYVQMKISIRDGSIEWDAMHCACVVRD